MQPLVVRPAEDDLFASCACCAGEAGVRGFVYEGEEPRAIYFAEALGMPHFPLIKLGVALGAWDKGARAQDRVRFAFLCKPTPAGPDMEPAEPELAGAPELSLMAAPVTAADLASHPQMETFRQTAKAIIEQDWRLVAIKGGEAAAPRRKFSAEAG